MVSFWSKKICVRRINQAGPMKLFYGARYEEPHFDGK